MQQCVLEYVPVWQPILTPLIQWVELVEAGAESGQSPLHSRAHVGEFWDLHSPVLVPTFHQQCLPFQDQLSSCTCTGDDYLQLQTRTQETLTVQCRLRTTYCLSALSFADLLLK